MPFILPFLPAIIGAAGAIGGAALSKKGSSASGGGTSTNQDPALNSLYGSLQSQSDKSFDWAGQDRASFKGALDPVSQWFQSILGNDRGAVLNAIGPEVKQTNQKYDAVSRAISEFAPRGGGRNAGLANLEFSKAGDISDLFSGARKNAAAGLQGVAGLYGNQSSTENATGLNALSTILSGRLGMRGQDIQKMLADKQNALGLGQSLGRLLSTVLGNFGGGGGGGALGSITSGSGVGVNFDPGGDLFDLSKLNVGGF